MKMGAKQTKIGEKQTKMGEKQMKMGEKPLREIFRDFLTNPDLGKECDASQLSYLLFLRGKISGDHLDAVNFESIGSKQRIHLFLKILPLMERQDILPTLATIFREDMMTIPAAKYFEGFLPGSTTTGGFQALSDHDKLQSIVSSLKQVYIKDTEIMRHQWSKFLSSGQGEFMMKDMFINMIITDTETRPDPIMDTKKDEKKHQFEVVLNRAKGSLILLQGDAGMGKSTYVHKLVKDWAEGDEFLNQEFKLILIIRLGEILEPKSLPETLLTSMNIDKATWLIQQVESDEELQKSTLLVLDGLDEFIPLRCKDLKQIMDKERWHLVNKLVSARPPKPGDQPWQNDIFLRSDGISQEELKKFFDERAHWLSEDAKKDLAYDEATYDLLRNPLFLGIFVALQVDMPASKELPELFHLMQMFKDHVVKRYQTFRSQENLDTATADAAIQLISKFAFELHYLPMSNDKCILQEISQDLGLAVSMGFLWPVRPSFSQQSVETVLMKFPHRSFREFFAAMFLCQAPQEYINHWGIKHPILSVGIASTELFNPAYGRAFFSKDMSFVDKIYASLHKQTFCEEQNWENIELLAKKVGCNDQFQLLKDKINSVSKLCSDPIVRLVFTGHNIQTLVQPMEESISTLNDLNKDISSCSPHFLASKTMSAVSQGGRKKEMSEMFGLISEKLLPFETLEPIVGRFIDKHSRTYSKFYYIHSAFFSHTAASMFYYFCTGFSLDFRKAMMNFSMFVTETEFSAKSHWIVRSALDTFSPYGGLHAELKRITHVNIPFTGSPNIDIQWLCGAFSILAQYHPSHIIINDINLNWKLTEKLSELFTKWNPLELCFYSGAQSEGNTDSPTIPQHNIKLKDLTICGSTAHLFISVLDAAFLSQFSVSQSFTANGNSTAKGLQEISTLLLKWEDLQQIHLKNCKITEYPELLDAVVGLRNLKELTITGGCKLSDQCLQKLGEMVVHHGSLKYLKVEDPENLIGKSESFARNLANASLRLKAVKFNKLHLNKEFCEAYLIHSKPLPYYVKPWLDLCVRFYLHLTQKIPIVVISLANESCYPDEVKRVIEQHGDNKLVLAHDLTAMDMTEFIPSFECAILA